jgi:hypothetical protein
MKIDGENIQNLFEDDDGKKKKKNFEKIQMWKDTIPHLFYLWIIDFNLKLSKWQLLQLQTYKILSHPT